MLWLCGFSGKGAYPVHNGRDKRNVYLAVEIEKENGLLPPFSFDFSGVILLPGFWFGF